MLTWLSYQFSNYFLLLRTQDSPRRLAAGFSAGLLIGLIPKGNLLAPLVATILFSLRLNLPVAVLTAACAGFASGWLDPISHEIGLRLLEHPGLRTTWVRLSNTPIVPWTGFNNTIVLGSLVLGLAVAYPAYWLSLPVFRDLRRKLTARAEARSARRRPGGVEEAAVAPETESTVGSVMSRPRDDSAVSRACDEGLRVVNGRRFREFVAEIDRLSRTERAA